MNVNLNTPSMHECVNAMLLGWILGSKFYIAAFADGANGHRSCTGQRCFFPFESFLNLPGEWWT